MPDPETYDSLANGERGYVLYCEILRLRHAAALSRRISALAERLAALCARLAAGEGGLPSDFAGSMMGAPAECANTRRALDHDSADTKSKPDRTDYPTTRIPVNPLAKARAGTGTCTPAQRAF